MSQRKFSQMINIPAEMPDGVKFSVDVRLPIGDGPFPAILLRTPYNKTRDTSDQQVNFWIDAGYAFVTQDCRGCHESEGDYDPFFQEPADGKAAVDWVAAQSWCDGRVSMVGGSYVGWTQLAAASKAPENLRAITPIVMGSCGYEDLAFRSGAVSLFLLWWLILNDGRSQRGNVGLDWNQHYRCLPVVDMDSDVGCKSPVMQKWLSHPTFDEFWQQINMTPALAKCQTPALMVGGWYDPFVNGTINTFEAMSKSSERSCETRMIIGPWGHGVNANTMMGDLNFGPQSKIDLDGELRKFIDAHNADAPAESIKTGPAAKVFVTGANQWHDFDCWPPENTEDLQLYIGSQKFANSRFGDGTLTTQAAASGVEFDSYDYDPQNPVPAMGGASLLIVEPDGPFDQRPAERRDDVLCYTGDTLDSDLEIVGRVKVKLFVSSSAVDTDFIARLCDVHPDGKSIFVCDGLTRMRFREGLDREIFIKPGEIYEIEINLGSCGHCFKTGHAIRLEITSSCMPRYERNCNTGGENARQSETLIATQKIFHDPDRPSMLILPVV